MRGGHKSAVPLIGRCSGGKEPRSGARMQRLSVVELRSGRLFETMHVPDVFNSVANKIPRWPRDDVHANLLVIRSDIPSQVCPLLPRYDIRFFIRNALLPFSLNELIRVVSVPGYGFVWVLMEGRFWIPSMVRNFMCDW